MDGSEFHENMNTRLESAFWKMGFQTGRQIPIHQDGRLIGFGDLLTWNKKIELVFLVESEMSKKRALNDVIKRRALGLGGNAILWIVTPTGKLAREIRQHLRRHNIDDAEPNFVLPFGAAMNAILEMNTNKIPAFVNDKRI